MKRIIVAAIFTFFLLTFTVPVCASAEENSDTQAEIAAEVDEMLADSGADFGYEEVGDMSFGGLVERVVIRVKSDLGAPSKLLGSVLIVTVFTAVVGSLGEGLLTGTASSLYGLISITAAAAVLTPQLLGAYERTLTAIDSGGSFILVFVPVFAGLTVASGGVASGSLYNMMILGASELVTGLADKLLMPVLSASAALAVTAAVFPRAQLEGIANVIRKAAVWCMTVSVTLFTGFVSLKCTLAGKADGAATKTARFMMSGMMPIVGGAVSDAYSAVRSSFDVIRGTVGTAGTIAVILIMLPPILELLAFRAVLMIGGAAAELLTAPQLKKLMGGIDSGLAIAQSVLIGFGLMFILCTAILMQAVK